MAQRTLRDRIRYQFDNAMTRRGFVLVPMAMLTAFFLAALFALLLQLFDHQPTTLGDAISQMYQRGLGVFFIQSGDGNIAIEVLSVLLGLVAVFVSPVLAGLVIIMAGKRINRLVRGRSVVLEKDHTVVLGWSEQVFPVISAIAKANRHRRKPAIVVLAEHDQLDMEDSLRANVGHLGPTRIICRYGSPIDANEIKVASLDTARSIIILLPGGPDPDKQVIKTLLAVANSPDRANRCSVVACVADSRNNAVARLAGGAGAAVIDADDVIAKLVVLTARQPGLSTVYSDLLDFTGHEIRVVRQPAVAGRSFGETLLALEACVPMGLVASDGTVHLKPSMDRTVADTDQLVVLTSDPGSVRATGAPPVIEEQQIVAAAAREKAVERSLVLGWNRRAPRMLENLDSYVRAGSEAHVLAHPRHQQSVVARSDGGRWANLSVSFTAGDPADRRTLESLAIDGYDHVVVLATDDVSVQDADASALVTLLHLRDLHDQQPGPTRGFSIVSEMLDDRNHRLGLLTKADDFIVSPKLISMLMAQLSESPHLEAVFADLLRPEGAELYLKPIGDYVRTGHPVDFHTVVEAARRREEVAVGYRLAAAAGQPPSFGVVLNPDKKDRVTFDAADRVIVLAED